MAETLPSAAACSMASLMVRDPIAPLPGRDLPDWMAPLAWMTAIAGPSPTPSEERLTSA
jgi:hypothetical protein